MIPDKPSTKYSPVPQWRLRKPAPESLRRVLTSRAGRALPPLLQRLLALRSENLPDVDGFLEPKLSDLSDPFLLPDMAAAVERIFQAVDGQETVVIYGDYDVDGVTSIALLHQTLLAYGLTATAFLPHRMDEGYGLSMDGIRRLLEDVAEPPALIIAVDCATSAVAEALALQKMGIDLIIVDHHESSPGGRPVCAALVNPKTGADYHYFCTVGLIFKLAHALMKQRRLPDYHLRDQLDLVALGTVADIVPLVGENRILVRRGMEVLEQTERPGLVSLKRVAGVEDRINAMHIGFRLGPRLNASGRLESAQAALDLLLTEDPQEADDLAEFLDEVNRERQQVEAVITRQAFDQLQAHRPDVDAAIVLGSRGWHPGVVGIVAARVMRQCHRPTFVVSINEEGMGKGSGRSVEGVSLLLAINECRDLLVKGGGHDMAAGLTIEEGHLDTFRDRFRTAVSSQLAIADMRPTVRCDAEAKLSELNLALLDAYQTLEPFGQGNPQPVFIARGLFPAHPPQFLKEKHLRLKLTQDGVTRDAMMFNATPADLPPPPWDIAFTMERNVYQGTERLQIHVQQLRAACELEEEIAPLL